MTDRQVRLAVDCEPAPSMLVIDSSLARGASQGGKTFHDRGGPYGATLGAKRVVAVLSGVCRIVHLVPIDDAAAVETSRPVLVSHTGVPLSRATTFRFTLDPNRAQHQVLMSHAGAARLAFNHHIARVKANLGQREAEASGLAIDRDVNAAINLARYTPPPKKPNSPPLPAAA